MIELETTALLYFLSAVYLLGVATVLGAFSLLANSGQEPDDPGAGCVLRTTVYLCLATAAFLTYSGFYG
jgi:hypothetical protein